jgi:Na+/H+ antiporter NhaA
MDAQWASAGIAAVCGACTVVSMLQANSARKQAQEANATNLMVKLELARFKDELKTWINGSFMRSKEVDAKIQPIEHRLYRLEDAA